MSDTTKENRQPVLLLNERDEYGYHHIGATFVYLSEDEDSVGQPRNYTSGMYESPDDAWADLAISSQGENDHRDRGSCGMYAWGCEYHSPYTVNLSRAQAMVKTLARLRHQLVKLNDTEGYAVTLGQYMVRVARAFGIRKFMIRTDPARNGWSSSGTYSMLSLADGQQHVDGLVFAWQHNGQTLEQAS